MKLDDLIYKKFKKAVVGKEAGEFLFRQKDALKMINEIERAHGIILGLDFWQRCDDGDVMEVNSTNWANINQGPEASKNTTKAARGLIGQSLPDNADYVSFVLKEQEVVE